MDNARRSVDNFFDSIPIISKKGRVFKAFSAVYFLLKMQFIHSFSAECMIVVHNILWLLCRTVHNHTVFPTGFLHFLCAEERRCVESFFYHAGDFCAKNRAACRRGAVDGGFQPFCVESQIPAVHTQHLPGDEGGRIGEQESRGVRDVLARA